MLTLSVRDPYAWLIIRPDLIDPVERAHAIAQRLVKDIENRTVTWGVGTAYPVPFRCAIHVSRTFDKDTYEDECEEWPEILFPAFEDFQLGGIIGTVDVVACVTEFDSPWFEGPYGFVLSEPRPCRFVKRPGRLGFFDVPDELIRYAD